MKRSNLTCRSQWSYSRLSEPATREINMQNLVTEKEALKKWCPEARVITVIDDGISSLHAITNKTAFNRATKENSAHQSAYIPQAATCVASKCMVWRFAAPIYVCTGYWAADPDKLAPTMKGRTVENKSEIDEKYIWETVPRGMCGKGGR